MGKAAGDTVRLHTPRGHEDVEIASVDYRE